MNRPTLSLLALASFVLACVSGVASARLLPRHVLVVYDSRDSDSLAVAEHYAGSAAVPGGVGGKPGARPGVHVLDLAAAGAMRLAGGDITRPVFIESLREPIRDHLIAEDLVRTVRCLVLVKGMPHRLQDFDDWTDPTQPGASPVGDDPSGFADERNERDASAASVDSELTVLWRNEFDFEGGRPLDSFADQPLKNPYHQSSEPITSFSTEFIRSPAKFFGQLDGGLLFAPIEAPLPQFAFTPGDMLLVCRLDGDTVEQVLAAIDRARSVVFDLDEDQFLFDEGASDGVAGEPNGEFDNTAGSLNAGDDFELARDELLADGRVDPGLVIYDGDAGRDNFLIGPNVSASQGIVVNGPVAFVASEGRNHAGGSPAPTEYGRSFDYAPGAIFTSIESYNGRDLNGIGNRFNQEQIADAIGAGATFAIGYVYEPFTDTIVDNLFLIRNFVLGDLTWAEAAYTALPAISWQTVVLGDPLAVAVRTSEDADGDGDLDADDLYTWESNPTDLNRDGAADAADRATLERSLRAGDESALRDANGAP